MPPIARLVGVLAVLFFVVAGFSASAQTRYYQFGDGTTGSSTNYGSSTTYHQFSDGTSGTSSNYGSGEPPITTSSERSPVVNEPEARRQATQNGHAAAGALLIDLGPLPVEAKDAQTLQRTTKRRQIGVHRSLPAEFTGNLIPLLEWIDGSGNQRIATITFNAEGAVSLRISVQAELTSDASVQVFDGEGEPRGAALTRADFDGGSSVWLPSVEGDTLSVEIAIPSDDALDALSFTVTEVAHRFASLAPKAIPECFGHVDIPCVSDQFRRDTADAIGLIEFEDAGSTYGCTGTLLAVGDTPDVFESYFLTANHCVATEVVAATVEAEWFWQNTLCQGAALDSRFTVTFGGTEILATSPRQDSTLLEFKRALPGGLLLSGWSTRDVLNGSSVFSVHHPNGFAAQYSEGQVRRILNADVAGNIVYDAIETAWSRGLTEVGSSGAGLFTSIGGYLVGVLAGGPTGCVATGDVFGPFRDFFPHARQWLSPSTHEPETFAHMVPAVPGADAAGIQGFIRILSVSDRPGEVTIHAIDDTGKRRGPVTLELNAFQTRHLNSDDLEGGAPSKGLHGSVGDGTGMWRLELETELTIHPLAYIRTSDGFLTSMHQVALPLSADESKYHVPFFNPGSNTAIRSLLRVINPNAALATVTVEGLDDDKREGTSAVRFSLPAGRAVQLSAQQLEAGAPAFTGRLGDGKGKWELIVTGSRPLHVMSLLSTASGHLTNLSQ